MPPEALTFLFGSKASYIWPAAIKQLVYKTSRSDMVDMTKRDNLQRRVFAEAVSLDFWHDPFGKKKEVGLHADVVFGTARVGGEKESSVRFRLRIKQADVVLIVPEQETVRVLKDSLERPSDNKTIKYVEKGQKSRKTKSGFSSKLETSFDAAKGFCTPSVLGAANASSSNEASAETMSEIESSESTIRVTLSHTEEGHYCWSIIPRSSNYLEGRPWAVEQGKPRAVLIDQRKSGSKSIDPVVYMEVRCRREDMEILDIELKDETLWDAAFAKVGSKNRLVAAEAFIRSSLSKEGLGSKPNQLLELTRGS